MGRYLFNFQGFLEVALSFVLLTICIDVPASLGQQDFLSVDCGSSQDNYTDDIGLSWVSDERYIRTGRNSGPFEITPKSVLLASTYSAGALPVDEEDYEVFVHYNYSALRDFRYFPEHRSKHCYDLPTHSNISYLIRAMFYYNASESDVLQLPIEFNVFVNSTNWFTVKYGHDYSQTKGPLLDVHEGIFYSPGSAMHFCLQQVTGVPFISSLELRPLDPEGIMYSYTGSKRQYLSLWARYNYGAPLDASPLRYPDDPFDRLWLTDSYSYINPNLSIKSSSSRQLNVNTTVELNNIPSKVMLDGMPLNFVIAMKLMPLPIDFVYLVIYFQVLNASESNGGLMEMTINDGMKDIYTTLPFNVTNNPSMQVNPKVGLGTRGMNVTFNDLSNSTSSITVTAAEIYVQAIFHDFITRPFEEEAIRILKASFNLMDWQGDPCGPIPYDWLTCSYYGSYWSVDTITLSNVSITGWPLFINKYNAIYNKSGDSTMILIGISITHSGIDDMIFEFLITFFTPNHWLSKLDFSYNNIRTIPPAIYNQSSYLDSLDLSHNALGGELSLFGDILLFTQVKELNLNHNAITSLGLPDEWESNVTTNLVTLDLSYNKLGGPISSLNKMVVKNQKSLEQLFLSYNNFIGPFPSELYFSNLSSLLIGNFDGNQIGGTLDLSAWYQAIQQEQVVNTSKVFSFVNNNIKDINPSMEVMEMTISSLLKNNSNFNRSGVLLGGNPYCEGAKSEIHRYLCRSTINDIYVVPKKKKNKLILIDGIIGGVLLLLVCCVLLATVCYLRNKVSALQQIQQVLAGQKVQPPFFYSYNDLKHATRNFHKDNRLGNGAFGVVYKGLLEDGTTLAIKKLFNSQQVQVLNEFLNEVMLITGIKHKNLVQLKGCCVNDKQRILVYEYVENGNLAEILWDKQASQIFILNWQQRFKICVGIAQGLSYLHEELQPRIIHRDIKPANILLDKNFNAKIGDFGLAKHYLNEQSQAQFTNIAGTRGYFAPEYASQGKLTEKADVFSFGILVLEIVSGRKVIDHNMPPERIYLKDWAQRLYLDGMLLELLQPELRQECLVTEVIRVINVALVCVQMHPERRATMSQVVTMLLGNMDATGFLDKGNYYQMQPNFNNHLPTNGRHSVTSALTLCNNSEDIIEEYDESSLLQDEVDNYEDIIEEFYESPLLQDEAVFTIPFNSNIGNNSIATIELSDILGR